MSQKAKATRNPSLILSLITLPVLFTRFLPVSPEKKRWQYVPKGAWAEQSVSSLQPTSCLAAVAALWLPRSLLRGCLCPTLLFSHFCKDPRLCYTPGLLWELAINRALEKALLQGDIQDVQQLRAPQCHSQGRTSGVQRAHFCSAQTVNWVRFKEWGGYFWSRHQNDSPGPVAMLKPDPWVYLCSSIFIQHDNNTEVNQGKFLKYILNSWYP